MTKFKKYIIVLVCFISYLSINAQDSFIYLKRVSNLKLEIYNQDNIKKGEVISSDNILWDISVSPKGNIFSLIEMPKDLTKSTKNSFKVLSENGNVIDLLDEDVRRYGWSNNGNNIAIITGNYHEGGIGFSPNEVFIYNIDKKAKVFVNGLPEKSGPYKTEWNHNDSILYIKTLRNSSVYKYDIRDKSLKLTEFKDLNFSPDGKYYYQEYNPLVGKEFEVYDTKSNTKVNLNIELNNLNIELKEYVNQVDWAPGKDHVLLYKNVIEEVEYEDHILPKNDATDKNEAQWVLRDFKSRKVTGIKYRFYDIESNKKIKELKTNGEEAKLIKSSNDLIYKENNSFKKFKF